MIGFKTKHADCRKTFKLYLILFQRVIIVLTRKEKSFPSYTFLKFVNQHHQLHVVHFNYVSLSGPLIVQQTFSNVMPR